MRRRPLALAAASVAVALSLQAGVVWPTVAQNEGLNEGQPGAPYCEAGKSPAFVLGMKALKDRLGDTMGSPVECEHVSAESGDTIQNTTTGLAYYRPSIVTAMFTDGATHWGLSGDTLVRWQGLSVTPPRLTDAEAAYLAATGPLRARAAGLQRRLTTARQQVERGQIESLDAAGLRALADELKAARDGYAAAGGPGRLWRYHTAMVVSLNEGMGAAEMLTQARQISSPDIRERLLTSAAKHRQESERLQAAAQDAYAKAMPVIVE